MKLNEKGLRYGDITMELILGDIELYFDDKGYDATIVDCGMAKASEVMYIYSCKGKDFKKVKSGDLYDWLFSENGILCHNLDFGVKVGNGQITITLPNTSEYNESKKMKKSMASLHSSNIKEAVKAIEKELKKAKLNVESVDWFNDEEDCFIDVLLKSEGGNKALYEFCVTFGTGIVYRLDGKSKVVDSFGNDNEIAKIIANEILVNEIL